MLGASLGEDLFFVRGIVFGATFAQSLHIHHGFLLFEHVETFGQDSGLILVALSRRFGRSAEWCNVFAFAKSNILTVHLVIILFPDHHVVPLRLQNIT